MRTAFIVFVLSAVQLWFVQAGVVCPSAQQSKLSSVKCNGVEMLNASPIPTCVLQKGKNSTLQIVFQPSVNVQSLQSVCHGLISGVPVPFNDIDHNGCDGVQPGCPLTAGQQYTFTASIPVKSIYPAMRLAVKWQEQDQATGKDIFCVALPAQIV